MTRCLILSCSRAKREDPLPLPAVERYDGPAFRVVRQFLREADSTLRDVDVFVLSARHGLIAATTPIHNYDQRMTPARAVELRPQVLERLQELLQPEYAEVFLSLGRSYLRAVEGFDDLVPDGTRVIVSRAPVGKRLAELKRWLYRLPEGTPGPRREERPVLAVGYATLRGQRIEATAEEVLALARQALAEGRGDPWNFRGWYTLVDGEKVSTKWLVSLLSGLPVSAFQASEARRVLRRLGVPVYFDGGV